MTNISRSSDFVLNLEDLSILDECCTGDIELFLPMFAYNGLLKFDMKMFVHVARLEMGQLIIQGVRRGIRVLWTHF